MAGGIGVKFLVVKIAPEQSEFPELIGDVLADVGDRAVRAHDYFCVVVFACRVGGCRAEPSFEAHHPAPGILSRGGKVNRVALLQQLERRIPEFQMQNFALAGQQVVLDSQPLHGAQVAANDGGRDNVRHFRGFARAFFDRFQHFAAQGEARFVFLEKARDARVQIPAVIIEFRLRGQGANFRRRFLGDVEESDDHVRNLHAGVVDVILHFDALPGAAQQAHERIAQHGVAQVADMRGLIRIDVGVFDDAFRRIGSGAGAVALPLPSGEAARNAAREK